jgi:two-component system response regulator AtoC
MSGGDSLTKKRDAHVPGSAPRAADWLMVFWEGGNQALELRRDGRVELGRAEECAVRIPHESVSRRHASVAWRDGMWAIEDLGSSNGTFVAGARLEPGVPHAVAPGAVVSLGEARVLIDQRGATSRAAGGAVDPAGAPMERVLRLVDMVADSVLPVLLLGETGVGKGRLANEVHARSSRAAGPFVRLNCAAVPETLLESELFGHERGAFTGAVRTKIGILESADKGTVFLDEIGEVPRSTQAKLLHALEHGQITRVGSVTPRAVDVRFLAATNRDLETLVAEGQFRRDLYYRLAGVPVHIPPLRERREEIPAMARAFLAEACAEPRRPVPQISPEALVALLSYPWTGNIRELRNVVMRSALLCGGPVVRPEHLMLDLAQAPAEAREGGASGGDRPLGNDLRDFERDRVSDALERFAGHQGKAAEYLGISRRTLTNKLTKLALPRPRKGKTPDA